MDGAHVSPPQKTKSMLITGKRLWNLVTSTSIDVSLNGSNIEHVTDFKLLGITLDQDLSFNRQIEELCKKLTKHIGLLHHISPYLKRNQRDIYYSTIIKPVMLHSSTIWTSCSKENLLKVLRLQKRAAKIILHAEKTAPSVGLFNTLKWVPFYAESYVNQCILIYKRLNGNTPEYINDLLYLSETLTLIIDQCARVLRELPKGDERLLCKPRKNGTN